jgi:hypothetical protein
MSTLDDEAPVAVTNSQGEPPSEHVTAELLATAQAAAAQVPGVVAGSGLLMAPLSHVYGLKAIARRMESRRARRAVAR